MNKTEKDRRKALKHNFKAKEKELILSNLPISLDTLKELFDWLDKKLANEDCDNTFKQTQTFIDSYNLPEKTLLEWVENQGGYCDCEILYNVYEQIEN